MIITNFSAIRWKQNGIHIVVNGHACRKSSQSEDDVITPEHARDVDAQSTSIDQFHQSKSGSVNILHVFYVKWWNQDRSVKHFFQKKIVIFLEIYYKSTNVVDGVWLHWKQQLSKLKSFICQFRWTMILLDFIGNVWPVSKVKQETLTMSKWLMQFHILSCLLLPFAMIIYHGVHVWCIAQISVSRSMRESPCVTVHSCLPWETTPPALYYIRRLCSGTLSRHRQVNTNNFDIVVVLYTSVINKRYISLQFLPHNWTRNNSYIKGAILDIIKNTFIIEVLLDIW